MGLSIRRRLAAFVCAFALLGAAQTAAAATVTLQWDANPEPDITGYIVMYGTQRGVYSVRVDVGKVTSTVLTIPTPAPPVTYYFAVAAYSPGGTSDPSTDVSTLLGSNPIISIDTPTPNQVLTSAFEVGGWAIDQGSQSGTGVDGVVFYVFPNSAGPGVFIGWGSYGSSRGDVGAAWGSQFTNSGYHFTITGLGPGAYMLGVYAHSTVSGAFNGVKTLNFTVSSTALMSIDAPSAEAVFGAASFGVSGWAIDRSIANTALGGIGVDQLHVYAYPNPGSGQTPIFLGIATPGIARSDVAAMYGSRYLNSGYTLVVDRAVSGLTPGVYNIAVHARSSVTGAFNNVALVRVTLQ